MHKQFLKYLCDPNTKEDLELISTHDDGDFIISGELVGVHKSYPIIRGVPRFVNNIDSEYVDSFSYQWIKWGKVQYESENIGKPMENYTRNMWESITSKMNEDLDGELIIDYGCGSGRFIEIVKEKFGKCIGIDLSASVEIAGEVFKYDPNVLICQADILFPPLKTNIANGVYSIGVLHHTPDPYKGFCNMADNLKKGGWMAISVYSKYGYYDSSSVTVYRKIFRLLWPTMQHYPALFYSYFMSYIARPFTNIPWLKWKIKYFFPHVRLKSIKWSLLDTFDSITTSYQSTYNQDEIIEWYKNCGFSNIKNTKWSKTSFCGKK